MTPADERELVRELARQYAELAADPVQDRRRDLWRRHNSLEPTPTPVFVRKFAWHEVRDARLACGDPFCRAWEDHFRRHLQWATFGDDAVFEPWVTVRAVHRCEGWGVEVARRRAETAGGSYKEDYPLRTLADVARLRAPRHEIDEGATREAVRRAEDLFGDLVRVDLDRSPAYRDFSGDLSTDLGHLRGIEHFMLDMYDDPEGLHRLCAFLRDGVAAAHAQAEAAGDWGLTSGSNQAMCYAQTLPDPAPGRLGVARRRLWGYMAAQEFTLVSPEMHEEFLLRYQLPILREFGLVAYGCCEDLTRKIGLLRSLPNLRRIAVAPAADVPACAEQIGADYVLSYRPSPTDLVGYGFDPGRVRRILRRDLEACRGCRVDITLKDVETVQGDMDRVQQFIRIAREVSEALI